MSDASTADGAGVRAVLEHARDVAQAADRDDLVADLHAELERLDQEAFKVLVIGEFGRGKSALVNALVAAPVCGVSAQAATSVPTFVRYGSPAAAHLVPPATADVEPAARVPVPLRETAELTLSPRGTTAAATFVAVDIELPRELLRRGLTLVDTAGVGGGFNASAAAATLRVLSAADAVLLVTDASSELTASEIDFLREALRLCPVAACVVTKTDLYPAWRTVVELNREQLRGAGLNLPVLPVSSPLRELSVDTGDAALAAESGFPVLIRALTEDLRRTQRGQQYRAAAAHARAAMEMVALQLTQEQLALANPVDRDARQTSLRLASDQASVMRVDSARWQEQLTDRMRTLRRDLKRDLDSRGRVVRAQAHARLGEGDPREHWAELESWLVRATNETLLAHHHLLMDELGQTATNVAIQLELELDRLPLELGPLPGRDPAHDLTPPTSRKGARTEVALLATRGFTLGSSVFGGSLTLMSLPHLLTAGAAVALGGPLVAVAAAAGTVAGTALAVRSVWSYRQGQVQSVRAESERSISGHLDEAFRAAAFFDEDALDGAFVSLRNYFSRVASRQVRSVEAAREAADRSSLLSHSEASSRARHLDSELARIGVLQGALGTALEGAEKGAPA